VRFAINSGAERIGELIQNVRDVMVEPGFEPSCGVACLAGILGFAVDIRVPKAKAATTLLILLLYHEQLCICRPLITVDDQTRFYVLWRWTYDGIGGTVGEATGSEKNGFVQPQVAVPTEVSVEEAEAEDEGESEEEETGNGKKKKKSGKKVDFGDAHLMATALGADVNALIHRYHILDGRSTVRLLDAEERQERLPDLAGRYSDDSLPPLIDVLHRCELLWADGLQDELDEYLDELSPDERETVRRVAQALVDLLPRGDLEKQRLEGFLYSNASENKSDSRRSASSSRVVQYGLGESFGQYDAVVRRKSRKRSSGGRK
jgi:hypothetical protein